MFKRVLSWIVLVLMYYLFWFATTEYIELIQNVFLLLPDQKVLLIVILVVFGAVIIYYPFMIGLLASETTAEKISPSNTGLRYVVVGVMAFDAALSEAISKFMLRDVVVAIYAICLIVYGYNILSDSLERMQKQGYAQGVSSSEESHNSKIETVSRERYDEGFNNGYDLGFEDCREDIRKRTDEILKKTYFDGFNKGHKEGWNACLEAIRKKRAERQVPAQIDKSSDKTDE